MQPLGEEIGSYTEYTDAQRTVDYLADNDFPVQALTIVGTDVRMVERITGKRTYGRVAVQGAMGGAWFGLFIGLMLMFIGDGAPAIFGAAVAIGAGFGMLFRIAGYAMSGGRRDFTSTSVTIPSRFVMLCRSEALAQARTMLEQMPRE